MPSIDVRRYQQKKLNTKTASNYASRLITLMNKDISLGRNGYNDKKKQYLYMELCSLLKAGINLKNSFDIITSNQKNGNDRLLLDTVQASLVSGSSFSVALQQTGKFSAYEVFSLQIGEETGKLVDVLTDLASYYQNKIKQRRKITGALTYPIMVIAVAAIAIFIMLKFVVPMFGEIFKRFGGHLPWITQKIISVSDIIGDNFFKFVALMAIVTISIYSIRHTEAFKKTASQIVLKLPLIGALVRKIYLVRFCNAMRLLIGTRIPLLRAIELVRKMIDYYPLESSLKTIQNDILKGRSLHESMGQFNIYPQKMVQLIKVGEETSQMELFFEKISEQYKDEVEYTTATISSVIEPLIIIFLGLIVAVILVAMYLPLFQMSNTFQ